MNSIGFPDFTGLHHKCHESQQAHVALFTTRVIKLRLVEQALPAQHPGLPSTLGRLQHWRCLWRLGALPAMPARAELPMGEKRWWESGVFKGYLSPNEKTPTPGGSI